MPIYEYICTQCETRFEHLARQADAPPPPCPACGSTEVTKLLSVVHTAHGGSAPPSAPQQAPSRPLTDLVKHGSTEQIVQAVTQAKKSKTSR